MDGRMGGGQLHREDRPTRRRRGPAGMTASDKGEDRSNSTLPPTATHVHFTVAAQSVVFSPC